MRELIVILLIMAGIVLSVCVTAAVLLFLFACERKAPASYDTPDSLTGTPYEDHAQEILAGRTEFLSLPWEEVTTPSFDGLTLFGRYLAASVPGTPEGKGTILMMHGFRSSGEFDFSCIAKGLHKAGYSLLVPDQRAHGKSEGKYITFGVKERYDVLSWLGWLKENRPDPCGYVIHGISMGASTVMMSAELGLPETVRGICADCGFTSPGDVMKNFLVNGFHIPAFPIFQLASLICRTVGGFSVYGADTTEALRHWNGPILLVHGTSDALVPCEMSEEAHAACPSDKKKLLLVEGAGHGMSYLKDPDRVGKALTSFLDAAFRS